MDRPNPGLYRDQDPESLVTPDHAAAYEESARQDQPAYGSARVDEAAQVDQTAVDDTAGEDSYGATAPEAGPAGGYARMPAAAPSPAAGGTPPMPVQDAPVMSAPMAQRRFDPWNYREEASLGDGADVVGYTVEAIDGHIGKIDESSTLVGESYLVVDTGPWIFGKRVLLPAGTVNHVDSLDEKVYVDRTRAQIKDSPEFDPDQFGPEYRDKIGGYYDATYDDPSLNDRSAYGDSRSAG